MALTQDMQPETRLSPPLRLFSLSSAGLRLPRQPHARRRSERQPTGLHAPFSQSAQPCQPDYYDDTIRALSAHALHPRSHEVSGLHAGSRCAAGFSRRLALIMPHISKKTCESPLELATLSHGVRYDLCAPIEIHYVPLKIHGR